MKDVLILEKGRELPKRELRMRVFRYVQNNTVMHGHSFAEIAVIISGKGLHRTFNGLEPLAPGDVLLVPEGAVHAYEEVDDLQLVNILFDPLQISMNAELGNLSGVGNLFARKESGILSNGKIIHLALDKKDITFVHELLDLMIREYGSGEPAETCAVLGTFLMLISRIARASGGQGAESEKKVPDGIARVVFYVLDNFEKEIELKDLVKISKMSSSSFMRVFSASKGTSPMNFLNEVRINKACSLLQGRKYGITEISGMVGFMDSNYFSRVFHKHIGISPREFRRASKQSML